MHRKLSEPRRAFVARLGPPHRGRDHAGIGPAARTEGGGTSLEALASLRALVWAACARSTSSLDSGLTAALSLSKQRVEPTLKCCMSLFLSQHSVRQALHCVPKQKNAAVGRTPCRLRR